MSDVDVPDEPSAATAGSVGELQVLSGQALAQARRRNRKEKPALGFLAAGAIIVLVVWAIWSLTHQDQGPISACEDYLKSQIDTPTTASFADVTVTHQDDNTATVSLSMTAQNDFGAMITQQVSCNVRQAGNDWIAD